MKNNLTQQPLSYMEWAKTLAAARFNLATSGVENYLRKDLPVTIEDIELSGASLYGYEPLQQALATRYQCGVESVVATVGTSMANYLVMATLLQPGDEVLLEAPIYHPILAVAEHLRAQVKRFSRRRENGFTIDTELLARMITPRTRLIVITNLHNPSGAYTDPSTLIEIGRIACAHGARVLVDEVYLEAMFDDAPRSAFHLGEPFIITNSLTKVYGLSGLRCGWVLAPPELARRMWQLIDLLYVVPAHPAERLSVIALANLDRIAADSRALLTRNQQQLKNFFASRDDLSVSPLQYGTVAFPRLLRGDVASLCVLLRDKYETSVVPGSFFEMPDHFRIGMGGNSEILAAGLKKAQDLLHPLPIFQTTDFGAGKRVVIIAPKWYLTKVARQ